ncbi:unnamed protein product [Lactuca virosa]|uniref:Uncharacterized protein n=1 Tax=Lactuca virosa TaxID=75947 RepID=A0AAU9MC39_9ASTR|nr:unnamed protein product [Lactuca virosa]
MHLKEDNAHNIVSTQPEHPNYKILKTIFEDAKVKDLSMEDNISFMLASIHKILCYIYVLPTSLSTKTMFSF